MAWVDSEQMWRIENYKRSLSDISNDSDPPSPEPSTDLFTFADPKPLSNPSKSLRIEQEPDNQKFICRVPPCHRNPPHFADLSSFERHHRESHSLVCRECKLHFPTERILSLHLEERHDPFVEIQRAKKTYKYKCFVDGCNQTYEGVFKRNKHMIVFHYFPANYYFGVVKFGIDQRDSMLTRENFRDTWGGRSKVGKKKSQSSPEDMIIDRNNPVTKEDAPEIDMEIESAKEAPLGDVPMETAVNVNGKETNHRLRRSKMPFYDFQRNGIGVVQGKRQYQKPKQK